MSEESKVGKTHRLAAIVIAVVATVALQSIVEQRELTGGHPTESVLPYAKGISWYIGMANTSDEGCWRFFGSRWLSLYAFGQFAGVGTPITDVVKEGLVTIRNGRATLLPGHGAYMNVVYSWADIARASGWWKALWCGGALLLWALFFPYPVKSVVFFAFALLANNVISPSWAAMPWDGPAVFCGALATVLVERKVPLAAYIIASLFLVKITLLPFVFLTLSMRKENYRKQLVRIALAVILGFALAKCADSLVGLVRTPMMLRFTVLKTPLWLWNLGLMRDMVAPFSCCGGFLALLFLVRPQMRNIGHWTCLVMGAGGLLIAGILAEYRIFEEFIPVVVALFLGSESVRRGATVTTTRCAA